MGPGEEGTLESTKFPFGTSAGMACIQGGLSASEQQSLALVSSRRVKSEELGWNCRSNPAGKLVCAKLQIKRFNLLEGDRVTFPIPQAWTWTSAWARTC